MAEKYTYLLTDFPYGKVNINKLQNEIRESEIITALDYINATTTVCDIWFKAALSDLDSTATLPAIIAAHDGEPLPEAEAPHMPDGRPIVRADTRPLDTQTYFTVCGDDSTSIGGGTELRWDFSNDDDQYTGPEVPSGYKAKQLTLFFHCPVYPKDGTIYFFDAPWGCFVKMDIVIPAGNYYPNPAGPIPAAALGLPGTQMYAYASEDVTFARYVSKHYLYGSCPMGDELNAEGCTVEAVPPGWYIRGLIFTPESDNVSKGFASFEMYRCHSVLLPGQTIESLHT